MNETRSDEMLVGDVLRGQTEAFAVLVERYQRIIYNAAYRVVGSADDARDVCQNVFLKVYQGLGSFNGSHPFYSWIYRITVNEALNFLGKRHPAEPIDSMEIESPALRPDQDCENNERRLYMQMALDTLSPAYRVVIVLKHVLGCTYEEMAGILQVPEKTVKSRLFTARQLLKGLLVQKGIM